MSDKKLKFTAIILSIIGLVDSIYLSTLKIGSDPIECLGGCDVVNNSKYAEIYGIPIAFLGVLAYFVILFILLRGNKISFLKENSTLIIFVFSLIGVIYSIYLTYLELYIIHAVCPYCVISAIALVLLLVVSVLRLKLELE